MTQHKVKNGRPLVKTVADVVCRYREVDPFGKVTVVVPSIYSAVYLRRALVRELVSRGSGLFNVAFERIEDVADAILSVSGASEGIRPMSRIVASEMVHRAVAAVGDLRYLGGGAQRSRYVDAIRSTLQELERIPGGAGEALANLSAESSAPVHRELAAIYAEYEKVSYGWKTRDQLSIIAAEIARSNESLVKDVVGTKCVLVMPHATFDANQALWDALAAMALSDVLLLEGGVSDADRTIGSTSFYSTMSAFDVPRQLLRNVLADARDGVRFGDMAVFVPDMAEASRLRDAFLEAGVPVAGPDPRGLAMKAVGRFVIQLLDAVAKDLVRESVMAWLTSSSRKNLRKIHLVNKAGFLGFSDFDRVI